MTGIFGAVGRDSPDQDRLNRLSRALNHRGPGPDARFARANMVLGVLGRATRSRTDLLCASDNGRIYAVLDGALCRSVKLPNERDAETLVRLYGSQGIDCFKNLRGAFAAAIWDDAQQELVLARDHFGQRPVFYIARDDRLWFASEARALLASKVVGFELDLEALTHFLSMRFLPAPYTFVKGIRKLPSAHALVWHDDRIRLHRYWAPSFGTKRQITLDDAVDGFEAKLSETIAAHLVDNRPIGAFLSAGLDSGLIVANLARHLAEPFHTFSLGVADASDEVPGARLVSRRFGTISHESYPGHDMVRLLPDMIWHADEPSDMVAVSKYYCARLAAPHVATVMAGDGGDEMFGGFPRYLGLRDAHYFGFVPGFVRNGIVAPLARVLGGRRGLTSLPGKLLWLTAVTRAGPLPLRYAQAVEYLRFGPKEKRQLLTDEAWGHVADIDSGQILADLVRQSDAEDRVEKLLHVDFLTRLPEHLLMLDDRAGAAAGVEVLCPLADHELVDFVTSLPANMKIRGRECKLIERRLAERTLPREVLKVRKTGWSFPFQTLCARELHPLLQRLFRGSRLAEDGYFRSEYLLRLLQDHRAGTVDHHIRIWMLLSLEIWYRLARDQVTPEDLTAWIECGT